MRSLRGVGTFSEWVAQTEARLSRMERRPQTAVDVPPVALLGVRAQDGLPEGLEPGIDVVIVETGAVYHQDPVTRSWMIAP